MDDPAGKAAGRCLLLQQVASLCGEPFWGLNPALGGVWARLFLANASSETATLASWGPLTPGRTLQGIDHTWPWGPDWFRPRSANTKVAYKLRPPPQPQFAAAVGREAVVPLSPHRACECHRGEEPRAMWSLGAPFLLLTACLAARASPVLTPPDDIQVQENFDVSRVRPACLRPRLLGVRAAALRGGSAQSGSQGWVPEGPSCPDGLGCPCRSVGLKSEPAPPGCGGPRPSSAWGSPPWERPCAAAAPAARSRGSALPTSGPPRGSPTSRHSPVPTSPVTSLAADGDPGGPGQTRDSAETGRRTERGPRGHRAGSPRTPFQPGRCPQALGGLEPDLAQPGLSALPAAGFVCAQSRARAAGGGLGSGVGGWGGGVMSRPRGSWLLPQRPGKREQAGPELGLGGENFPAALGCLQGELLSRELGVGGEDSSAVPALRGSSGG